ncbi:MAG: hypothetical protein H7321_08590 [Bacteroidia bacterium]|nr:hypothetical protein [Bacteroidia bacterium]
MNYLGHFYFDRIKGIPAYNLGLVLPDLVKNFTGIRLNLNEDLNLPESNNLFLKGSKKHIVTDKIFHSSAFFKDAEAFTLSMFKEKGVYQIIPRSWFLAHIANELILDKVLMLKENNLANDFYNDLNNINIEDLTQFLQSAGVVETASFLGKFQKFKDAAYLPHYLHNEKLVFALNRIYMRVGMNQEWINEQKQLLESCIETIENYLELNFPLLQQEMLIY